ncbi:MAG: 8-oxo-dGTP diphosphatase [Eubacteriales bacterium]
MKFTRTEIVNMIMVENRSTKKVLVLDRTLSAWRGLTFPGGHVEWGESFYDAAIRETKEETGLDVKKLIPCGIVNWANKYNGERYIELLYKTHDFYGILTSGTREGSVLWMDAEELKRSDRLSQNFGLYLPMFFENKYSEMFFEWDGKSWTGVPKYL